jgi:hypothetical protein
MCNMVVVDRREEVQRAPGDTFVMETEFGVRGRCSFKPCANDQSIAIGGNDLAVRLGAQGPVGIDRDR